MLRTSRFAYHLPEDRIAQSPLPRREDARMLVLDRATGAVSHRRFAELPAFLDPGDLVVLNDTRVVPARLHGRKERGGGRVEILLIEPAGPAGTWDALVRASRRPRRGSVILLADGRGRATLVEEGERGRCRVRIASDLPISTFLARYGETPLPPYIRRPAAHPAQREEDRGRYQTAFARSPGAVAAPTAGLHFTNEFLETMRSLGIPHTMITLHVGIGTFRPVVADRPADHEMDAERYHVNEAAAAAIRAARERGRRVVAVGSTTVRTLETCAAEDGTVEPGQGRSRLFIYPPYRFRATDALLTNFHLPRSTLLMMVCAFAGIDPVLDAYREAIRAGYRFYSYGDCMLVL